MTWKIDIDPSRCIASGMCAALAPERFVLDGAHAVAITADADPDDILLDAADMCPANAITITDDGVEIGPRP